MIFKKYSYIIFYYVIGQRRGKWGKESGGETRAEGGKRGDERGETGEEADRCRKGAIPGQTKKNEKRIYLR